MASERKLLTREESASLLDSLLLRQHSTVRGWHGHHTERHVLGEEDVARAESDVIAATPFWKPFEQRQLSQLRRRFNEFFRQHLFGR